MAQTEATPGQNGLGPTGPGPSVVDDDGSGRGDPTDFAVLTVGAAGEVVVAVRGDVDLATAPELWRCLEEAIPEATDRLVVDLADTTFIDSTALGVLLRAFERLRHAESDLVLRAPSKTARKVFATTGLDRVMTIQN